MAYLWLLACAAPTLKVEVTVDPKNPALLVAHWSTPEATTGTVSFGAEGSLDRVAAPEPASTEHSTLLLGLAPDQDVQVSVTAGEETVEVIAHTGSYDEDVPVFSGTVGSAKAFFGYTALATVGGQDGSGARMAMILDPEGRTSWIHSMDDGEAAFRTRLARDGSGVLYSSEAMAKSEDFVEHVHRVTWTGEDTVIETPGLHHDFVEMPDGSIVFLGIEAHNLEQITVVSDTLEMVAPDGTTKVLWKVWDSLAELGLEPFDPAKYADDPDVAHANHLVYLEDQDAFLITLLRSGVVALVGSDGQVRWAFGGFTHDYQTEAGELPLGRIHGAALKDDQLAIFRNDRGDTRPDCSEVRIYRLGSPMATREATLPSENCNWVYVFGEFEFLPQDREMVSWSTMGRMDELDATGQLAYRAEVSTGNFFGYTSFLGMPF